MKACVKVVHSPPPPLQVSRDLPPDCNIHDLKGNANTNSTDKKEVIEILSKLQFSMDHILRALKLYEHNYGVLYDVNAVVELIVRLQQKDASNSDSHTIDEKDEEKRSSTKHRKPIIDDAASAPAPQTYHHHKTNSLSLLSLTLSQTKTPMFGGQALISAQSVSYSQSQSQSQPYSQPLPMWSRPLITVPKTTLARSHTDNDHSSAPHSNIHPAQKNAARKPTHKKTCSQPQLARTTKRLKNTARDRVDTSKLFKPSMTMAQANKLRLYDHIDHRDEVGKFCTASIVAIDAGNRFNLKVHYEGDSTHRYDVWCNYKQELHRFATYRSISRRFQCTLGGDELRSTSYKLYKPDLNIGDTVRTNPIYTDYGGHWYRGIVNKFDQKSDQIQVAYKVNENDADFMLYWSHIENIYEMKPCRSRDHGQQHQREGKKMEMQKQQKKAPKIRNGKKNVIKRAKKTDKFSAWNTKQVISWIESVADGRFRDDVYDHFKQQIAVVGLKGYELSTLNETALKFAGLLNQNDRRLLINHVLRLVNGNVGRLSIIQSDEDEDLEAKHRHTDIENSSDESTDETVDGDAWKTTTPQCAAHGQGDAELENMIDVELNLKLDQSMSAKQFFSRNCDEEWPRDRAMSEVMGLWNTNMSIYDANSASSCEYEN